MAIDETPASRVARDLAITIAGSMRKSALFAMGAFSHAGPRDLFLGSATRILLRQWDADVHLPLIPDGGALERGAA